MEMACFIGFYATRNRTSIGRSFLTGQPCSQNGNISLASRQIP